VEDDAVAQLLPPRPHDLVHLREPERDKEQSRLVDVPVVAVDDVDLGLIVVEAAAQPVGGHRAAGSPAEDHDPFPGHVLSPPVSTHRVVPGRPSAIGACAERGADNYAAE